MPTRALVQISHKADADDSQLKRLALFFDEIHFLLPTFWLLNDEFLDDPKRVERLDNGLIRVIGGVDPLRNTNPAMKAPLGSLGPTVDHTLSYLIEAGIASEYDAFQVGSGPADDLFREVRQQLAWQDAKDPKFAAISGTLPSEYQSEYIPLKLELYEFDRDVPIGREVLAYAVIPPSALVDSFDLTTILHTADETSASPVFLKPVHNAELAYRYQQYRSGLSILRDQIGEAVSASEFRDQFGAVAFRLANAVITSEQVGRLSIEEIVELRSSMDSARRRFVSEHLVSATDLIESNPWDEKVENELERFVQGQLTADLLRFQDESKTRFEKLFGTFTGPLVDLTRGALIGSGLGLAGSATGFTATVIPGVAPWQMILIAALGGAVRQAPEVARAMVDALIEQRKAQRSSIAYLAAITKETQ